MDYAWDKGLEAGQSNSIDGQDILGSSKSHVNSDESSDEVDFESLGRIYSGAAASSSSSISKPESCSLAANPLLSSSSVDSFYKLRYVNNNSWSIKRRFRHFEELHRHLKEFPEYNLHLPPKHFLSTGLDVAVIQEWCELLDKYLKKLMQQPKVSESIELWDFLSVDSQTYIFSNSFSIMETLPVGLNSKLPEKTKISSSKIHLKIVLGVLNTFHFHLVSTTYRHQHLNSHLLPASIKQYIIFK
ncbi:hypothetical protein KIW84_054085 [Lathyrus oleraceus]|uniref:PX domain-containing protein n=1 Tax=Pisum sativum TaxID=3888 RepID=A0A9D5AJN5_PEA|nr:hypothetical protein KIW84_054085 [Pisum sativum]